MKLGQLINPQFQATFAKISNASLPAAGLWKVKRMSKWVEEQFKHYEEVRMEICKRFADKDEAGEPVMVDNKFQGLENKPEFLKEIQGLHDTELDVKIKFKLEEIEAAKLTGNDLITLDELVFEPDFE